MKTHPSLSLRYLVTVLAVFVAAGSSWMIWDYYMNQPWTRDGRVCADIIRIAPDVSGLVSEVLVHDNQAVRKGDVLFRVDKARFLLSLQQNEATLARAEAALQLARRDYTRNETMESAVSRQKLDELGTATLQADAACRQALADRDTSRLNLDRAEVKAPVDGILTNFSLQPGNYVATGQPVAALLDGDTFYVTGYFEETKLRRIRIGAPATVRLLGGDADLHGSVNSIAAGIEDRERSDSSRLLANVNPTFSWVRLPQRIPVRITLEQHPKGVRLVAGQTATVSVNP